MSIQRAAYDGTCYPVLGIQGAAYDGGFYPRLGIQEATYDRGFFCFDEDCSSVSFSIVGACDVLTYLGDGVP